MTRFQALFVCVLRQRYNTAYKEIDRQWRMRYIGKKGIRGEVHKGKKVIGKHLCKLSNIILS